MKWRGRKKEKKATKSSTAACSTRGCASERKEWAGGSGQAAEPELRRLLPAPAPGWAHSAATLRLFSPPQKAAARGLFTPRPALTGRRSLPQLCAANCTRTCLPQTKVTQRHRGLAAIYSRAHVGERDSEHPCQHPGDGANPTEGWCQWDRPQPALEYWGVMLGGSGRAQGGPHLPAAPLLLLPVRRNPPLSGGTPLSLGSRHPAKQ